MGRNLHAWSSWFIIEAHDLLSCAADNEAIEFIDANLVQKYEVGKDEDTSAPRGQETAPINLFDKP